MLGSAESEMVRLISRDIILAEFPATYMITIGLPQRYRQMDRQLALAIPRYA